MHGLRTSPSRVPQWSLHVMVDGTVKSMYALAWSQSLLAPDWRPQLALLCLQESCLLSRIIRNDKMKASLLFATAANSVFEGSVSLPHSRTYIAIYPEIRGSLGCMQGLFSRGIVVQLDTTPLSLCEYQTVRSSVAKHYNALHSERYR